MHLDSATRLDLDLFATVAAGGLTIFGLLDRTRSMAGREHLRQYLEELPATAPEILARQQSHQAIAADAAAYRGALDRANLDAVQRYLTSRWQLPSSRRWVTRVGERVWLGVGYPALMHDIEDGQQRVLAMFRAADEIRRRLVMVDQPVVQERAARLTELLDAPEWPRLLQLGRQPLGAAPLAFDQLARGAAKARLQALVDELGAFEALWSLAAATVEHGWTYPVPGRQLRIDGLAHPFLGRFAVRNDFAMPRESRVCFLTGPNMAGKSTFLKAVAIAMLLAHAGCGVPATTMEFVPVRTVFSSVQIVDNLGAGESFYLAEVRRIRALARAIHEHGAALAVIDEPFRGTNVHDATEATLEVIVRLAAIPQSLTIVASHLGELGPKLIGDPRIVAMHFAADESGEVPRFDFRLRDGISTQRLGMTLLRQEQVLDLLDAASHRDVTTTPAEGPQDG